MQQEQLINDMYGRSVYFSTDLVTVTYTVNDNQGAVFSLSFPAGTPQTQAYSSINALQPIWYVPPSE
jgi:hypothetical protein